ncbi:molybdopterin-dependent oxidoreductase [Roseibacterium sp. SDUM158017]|uniref:molybdopterin-containing oxidoreductase family protein n=1 Tax=Roseicyclus salinarum TaxID=3036773 RepID=UPI002414D13F|nr:molybdopterin-dependent oxidoreductase [Roseibacterium sp. SDUM158017]MDG4647335.1 molybdopterin-dependent oxidoreductase [Roseibacterium sp. SDUM158017]
MTQAAAGAPDPHAASRNAPRTVRTMCPMNCHPTLCGMSVTVADDGGVSIEGDATNPDSKGFLCMRGRAAHEIVGNDRRLVAPRLRERRGSDDWQETDWDGALDRMADAMRRVGREAVGFWQGHGNMANDYGVGLKRGQMERFANLYGCQHWNPAMICWGLGGFGLGLTGALETSTKEDMGDHSAMVILWGANTVSQAHTLREVERAKRRGARIVVIDVRRTEAGALADEVILVRPGTDAALALAMMQVIVAEGLWDRTFVTDHTLGFDALRAHLSGHTPEWAEALTGVAAERIGALARDYARTAPAMIVLGGSSIHKGANAWHAARAVSCLPALTGQYGRPGGGLGPRHGGRSHGAGFADISAGDRRRPGRHVPNQMEAILEALESGAVKVLVSIGSNMLSSFPDTNRLRAALARAELVVAYDIFENQFIREAADIVLPGTIWLEEIGAKSTNTHVHLTERVLPPIGHARPSFEIYRGLAARLGVDDVYPWADQDAALDAVLDHPATGHASVASLRRAGGRQALRISHVAHPDRRFATPSGRIEFHSERAAAMGLPSLPVAPAQDAEPGLTLAHGRTFAHFHSFYDHGRALPTLAAREDAPELWIAVEDAAARAVRNGDAVEVANARGRFRARARVTPRIPAGTLWMRDGWPGFNALTDGAAVLPEAALSAFAFSVGQSGFGARVEVTRLDEATS